MMVMMKMRNFRAGVDVPEQNGDGGICERLQ